MRKPVGHFWPVLLFITPFIANFPVEGQVNVTQHHNHSTRDGLYVDPAFTQTLAAGLRRDTNFNGAISGNVYAQPLYIEDGPGGKAMVIAVTESNNVYALDAINGTVIWRTNVGTVVQAGVLPCGDVTPVGITGTPVVDLPSRSLFFDAMIRNPTNNLPEHFIYSVNVDSGQINPGWPLEVNTNAYFGGVFFNSPAQGERGALAVVGANVYVPYGGIAGDCGTYYGWVVGVPMANPAPVNMFTWATTARGGGIWAVGGIASDGTDIFVATGNTFGASVWGGGEAVIHLPPNLSLPGTTHYWAPTNWKTLDTNDTDIGGSGPLLVDVPGATPSQLVAAFGKDGNAYLLARTNLGGVGLPLAQLHVLSSTIIQASAAYQTALGTYVVCVTGGNLYSLRIGASNPPTLTVAWNKPESSTGSGRGSPFVTSTDGTNNVIVWGVGSEADQRLHGFDGDTGASIFTGGGASELMSGTRRWNTGIAARGHIYVANDGKVYSFIVPGQTAAPIVLSAPSLLPGGAFQIGFTNTPTVTFSVFGTTNITIPLNNWDNLGAATEIAPGRFQFADSQVNTNQQRFYSVHSP